MRMRPLLAKGYGEDLAGAGELVADGAVALGQAVLGVCGEGGDEGLEVGVVTADGGLRRTRPVWSPRTWERAMANGASRMFVEVLAPGCEGVFLVVVPLGEVAVVGACPESFEGAGGGQAVPARGVVDAGNCLRSCLADYVAEEDVGQAGFE